MKISVEQIKLFQINESIHVKRKCFASNSKGVRDFPSENFYTWKREVSFLDKLFMYVIYEPVLKTSPGL